MSEQAEIGGKVFQGEGLKPSPILESVKQVERPQNFERIGPYFRDVAKDSLNRTNEIASSYRDLDFKQIERTFNERQGLADLEAFLQKTIKKAGEVGNEEILRKADAFRENLVYIGEHELQEGLHDIGLRIVRYAQEGKQVLIPITGLRSERYISLRVMEEVDAITEDKPDIRERVRFSEGTEAVVERCLESKQDCKVIIVDDFILSGSRVKASGGQLVESLVNKGFSPEEASGVVEVDVVAMPVRTEPSDYNYSLEYKQSNDKSTKMEIPIRVHSYYGVNEYQDKKGEILSFVGISLSGSHSSVDYGFEELIEKFQGFLTQNKERVDLPLLVNIRRPYELEEPPERKFKDPGLQERWEKVIRKYQL